MYISMDLAVLFQHTAARRRLTLSAPVMAEGLMVSTHSRPKAADQVGRLCFKTEAVSTHSRPKAADF